VKNKVRDPFWKKFRKTKSATGATP
jgi:hypothetical protein